MVWLLLMVYLGGDPVSIQRGEVLNTFVSSKACQEALAGIELHRDPNRYPEMQLGCISYPKRAI